MILIMRKRVIKEKAEKINEVINKMWEKILMWLRKKVANRWLIKRKIIENIGKINKVEADVSCDSPQGKE